MADKVPELEGEILLRDIDDEIQQDALNAAWKHYGAWVIAVAVGILLAVGGWQGWLAWRNHSRLADAAAFEAALSKVNATTNATSTSDTEAAKAFAAIAGAKGNPYAIPAQLSLATNYLSQGREKDAVALYQALMDDPASDSVFRDLARLLFALHGLNTGVETATIEAAIAPLADPSNAFHPSALEVRGLLALKQGKAADALALFEGLSNDATAPAGVKARAQSLAASLASPSTPSATAGAK